MKLHIFPEIEVYVNYSALQKIAGRKHPALEDSLHKDRWGGIR